MRSLTLDEFRNHEPVARPTTITMGGREPRGSMKSPERSGPERTPRSASAAAPLFTHWICSNQLQQLMYSVSRQSRLWRHRGSAVAPLLYTYASELFSSTRWKQNTLKMCLLSSLSSSFYLPYITTVCTSTSIQFRRAGQQGPTRTLTAALKRLITAAG